MAFCGVMQSTRLPPMAAMGSAATAVGLLYLEVADAHRGDNPCPCGWEPRGAMDVEALQTSLALATRQHRPAYFPAIRSHAARKSALVDAGPVFLFADWRAP